MKVAEYSVCDLAEMSHTAPPEFDQNILEDFFEYARYRVFTRTSIETERKIETLNMNQLYGTSQSHYSGDSLGYVLRNRLKRLANNVEEAMSQPEYFLDSMPKQYMGFYAVGDRLFVDEGKHRALCLKYLAHYRNDLFPNGPVIAGCETKRLEEVADFTAPMEEFDSLLATNRQLMLDFPRTFSGLNNDMPTLRNFERDKHHKFTSVDEFIECMNALKRTNTFKKMLGFGWHRLF